MMADGVPWIHNMHKILDEQGQMKSLVSDLYSLLLTAAYMSLHICVVLGFWIVWIHYGNLIDFSKNPNQHTSYNMKSFML